MKNKQTAVEWLIEQLTPSISLQQKYVDNLQEQAKEMEKQQICIAYLDGKLSELKENSMEEYKSPLTYYKETYGKETHNN